MPLSGWNDRSPPFGLRMSQHAIRAALHAAAGAGVTDAELLTRFAATRDESAFELLVWRPAPSEAKP